MRPWPIKKVPMINMALSQVINVVLVLIAVFQLLLGMYRRQALVGLVGSTQKMTRRLGEIRPEDRIVSQKARDIGDNLAAIKKSLSFRYFFRKRKK